MIKEKFFFNDTATTEIYTLSLHDALPILPKNHRVDPQNRDSDDGLQFLGNVNHAHVGPALNHRIDRKSTRLNSSHANISYAVFCLKKKIISSHHSQSI